MMGVGAGFTDFPDTWWKRLRLNILIPHGSSQAHVAFCLKVSLDLLLELLSSWGPHCSFSVTGTTPSCITFSGAALQGLHHSTLSGFLNLPWKLGAAVMTRPVTLALRISVKATSHGRHSRVCCQQELSLHLPEAQLLCTLFNFKLGISCSWWFWL